MARLVEVLQLHSLPPRLFCRVGDLLLFKAGGGHIRSGVNIVQLLGPFIPGLLQDNGQVISPMGAPNTVLFLACQPGCAKIDIVTGHPLYERKTASLEIEVEP